MTVVALALVAALAATVIALGGLLRSQARTHARREDLLLNQLLHAVGNPWQPAPADAPVERERTELPEVGRFVTSPEQYA